MQVKYNVTGARRKELVKVIADTTGAKAEYKSNGDSGYHQPVHGHADQQHEETPCCRVCPRLDRP